MPGRPPADRIAWMNGHAPRRSIDLRGEKCPYTFIKSRLAIEELEPGEVLEVQLDFPPAYTKVPASLAVLGHETLAREATPDGMTLRFRCATSISSIEVARRPSSPSAP